MTAEVLQLWQFRHIFWYRAGGAGSWQDCIRWNGIMSVDQCTCPFYASIAVAQSGCSESDTLLRSVPYVRWQFCWSFLPGPWSVGDWGFSLSVSFPNVQNLLQCNYRHIAVSYRTVRTSIHRPGWLNSIVCKHGRKACKCSCSDWQDPCQLSVSVCQDSYVLIAEFLIQYWIQNVFCQKL